MTELDLDVRWYTGTQAQPGPIQVHRAAEHTVLLRQSIAENYEAPFLYLLFGAERALLLDTGATSDASKFPLRAAVDALIEDWLTDHPHLAYELVVAHSHAHGDHVAADGQFAGRPRTRVVGHSVEDVAAFFGVEDWPHGTAQFDLGGRVLDVIPSPGHHPSAVTVYDPTTAVLLTGDTVYPGRLYVGDFPAFEATLRRLCRFGAARPVAAVLGSHIEMSTRPFRDFPLGSTRHPDEAPLPLTFRDLSAIKDAAALVALKPGAHRFANFIIWNGPCRREAAAQFCRLVLSRLARRLPGGGRTPRRAKRRRQSAQGTGQPLA